MKTIPSISNDVIVLLINLNRAKKRFLQMKTQFEKFGIQYHRIQAIDGKSLIYSNKEFNKKKFRACVGKKINTNEIACYLSHYKAIEFFMKSEKEFALIFEDDVVFNDDLIKIINRLVKIKNRWNFIKFNTARDGGIGNIAIKNIFQKYCMYASLFPKTYSGAYLIDRKSGRSLIEKLLPMSVPFDHEMIKFWKYNIRQYSIFPSPVKVKYEDSFIGGYGKHSNKFPFYKRISVLFYRILTQVYRIINFHKLF